MTSIAVVCASNQNRSMEAHHVLKKEGYDVSSFGTGSAVRLPGPSADKPNIYNFGHPYDDIYTELYNQDKQLYTQNGLLQMLDRNRKIKKAPERFQDSKIDTFDVIITCEERCYDAAYDDILNRVKQFSKPMYLINVEIIDNHEQACVGGQLILQLVKMIKQSHDLYQDMDGIIGEFTAKTKANVLYSLNFI
ncbi:RNA polymerase II subunit A [Globomyces pollinis-pini]|nr:RNA polymerase II subunit A [Globomyces pollinis-pini]